MSLSKIPKFEEMYLFPNINYENTSSDQVSAKKLQICSRYCQKGNSDKKICPYLDLL